MQLEDIRIFVTIVNMGSFTAAAEHLQLSKQYVSRRMAALEKKVAARLLVRNTRKLSVTDTGQVFFHHAQRILEEVQEAEQVISARQQKLTGSYRISLPMIYGVRRLAPLVVEFQSAHPELAMHIDMSDAYRYERSLCRCGRRGLRYGVAYWQPDGLHADCPLSG